MLCNFLESYRSIQHPDRSVWG